MTKRPYIPAHPHVFAEMNQYAGLNNITLADLLRRMWTLYLIFDQMRENIELFPGPPADRPRDELDAFLEEMQEQANNLDEEIN